ncbi:MAG: Trm112 family protein [Nitrospinota bacterium]
MKNKSNTKFNESALELLYCLKCRQDGTLSIGENEQIICNHCKVYYEIKDGIPVMLEDEAKPLSE